jgi:hypothetical protein
LFLFFPLFILFLFLIIQVFCLWGFSLQLMSWYRYSIRNWSP